MTTTTDEEVVFSTEQLTAVLTKAAEVIADSPGLVNGTFYTQTPDGTCYCLIGAVDSAIYQHSVVALDPKLRRRLSLAVGAELARTVLTLHPDELLGLDDFHGLEASLMQLSNLVFRYNDRVLMKAPVDATPTVSEAGKRPAVDLITATIDRLKKETTHA